MSTFIFILFYRCNIFYQKIEALTQIVEEKDENIKSFEQKIEFLEQTHLSKANFFSNKEKNYIKKMKDLESHLDEIIQREAMARESNTEKKQKWKMKEKHYLNTINLIKSSGESEWLNVYNK